MVHAFGVVGYGGAAEVAHDFKHAVVVVHRVLEVEGGIVEFLSFGEITFFESYNLLHQRMLEMELQIGIVCIKISHCVKLFFVFFFCLDSDYVEVRHMRHNFL